MGRSAPEFERRAALERARTAITDSELAGLVAEQQAADTHRVGARWIVSLDDVDLYGRPLYEVIAA